MAIESLTPSFSRPSSGHKSMAWRNFRGVVLSRLAGRLQAWSQRLFRLAGPPAGAAEDQPGLPADGHPASPLGTPMGPTQEEPSPSREMLSSEEMLPSKGAPQDWLRRAGRKGPPAHWLAYIRQRAPHLLEPNGNIQPSFAHPSLPEVEERPGRQVQPQDGEDAKAAAVLPTVHQVKLHPLQASPWLRKVRVPGRTRCRRLKRRSQRITNCKKKACRLPQHRGRHRAVRRQPCPARRRRRNPGGRGRCFTPP